MMSYARIDEGFWTDPKIKSLPIEGKIIAAWLFTNPHRHFSGIYYLPKVLIGDEIGLSIGVSDKNLKYLEDIGFLKYDYQYSVVWVVNMLRHQTMGVLNEKQSKGISTQLKTLHGCPLIKDFLKRYSIFKIKYDTPIDTPIDIKSQSQSQSQSKSKSKSQEETPQPPFEGGVSVPLPKPFSPQDLARLWNEKAPPELRRVDMPFKRQPNDMEKIRDAVKRNPDMDWWERVVLLLHQLPFCRGQGDRGWKITFDVMVRDAEKILDGKYAGGKSPQPKSWGALKESMDRRTSNAA